MANLVPVPDAWAKKAHCDNATYIKMYEQSVKDPEGFWGECRKKDRLVQTVHQGQRRGLHRGRSNQVVR